jgi:hypothetical protein
MLESDEDRRWQLLDGFVRETPRQAIDDGACLLASDRWSERLLGADLLGQAVTVQPSRSKAIADPLLRQLEVEPHADVIASIVVALGHAGDSRAHDRVAGLAQHDDVGVRFAVAFALPSLELDEAALGALCRLSADADDDVRDWATFGLAESNADDDRTVGALAARADDAHDDTRAEAIYGLARRQHPAAKALVDRELAMPIHGSLIERAYDELLPPTRDIQRP